MDAEAFVAPLLLHLRLVAFCGSFFERPRPRAASITMLGIDLPPPIDHAM
jgi:hypothetical protein